MATTRTANAHWEGPLLQGGKGTVALDSSNAGRFDVSWASRSGQPEGQTSPEELIARACPPRTRRTCTPGPPTASARTR